MTPRKLNPLTEWLFIQREMSTHLGQGICCTPLPSSTGPGVNGTSPAWRAEWGCLPWGLSPVTPSCISFYTHGKGLIWRQFYLAQCLVQWGKGVDRANWYIIKSHPLFLYSGDWRTANASGQRTDMKCFLPPLQNLGEDNTGTFFHPVSKAGRTRGGFS